jgi:hypothetical protein
VIIEQDVLNAFNLCGDIIKLNGGQNTSVLVNDYVLKPVGNDELYCEWLLHIITNISPEGYRLSKPLLSTQGTFVYNGWCCTHYEIGEHRKGNLEEKLKVSRLLHNDLANLNYQNVPPVINPWSKSHLIAWQKESIPHNISKKAVQVLEELLFKVELRDEYKVQIVHSDLAGNILFDESLCPLVIDFSPTVAPVEYAEAILVCDSIAWHGSSISEIYLINHNEYSKEMILRAIIFRLSVAAIFAVNNFDEFNKEYDNFKPIIDFITGYYD